MTKRKQLEIARRKLQFLQAQLPDELLYVQRHVEETRNAYRRLQDLIVRIAEAETAIRLVSGK